MSSLPLDELATRGYALLADVYSSEECRDISAAIEQTLAQSSGALRRAGGGLYGGRNLIRDWSAAAEVWRKAPLVALLSAVLGPAAGLVRVLYFDKPPDAAWSLAWHRDLTIAVAEHREPLGCFRRPTVKGGIAHVEAPEEILARMLTLRIHLDPMTDDNGPLLVLPGSHCDDRAPEDDAATTIRSAAGAVLAMRPMLLHASRAPATGCASHRRVLHLEFAADPRLPADFAWRDFLSVGE